MNTNRYELLPCPRCKAGPEDIVIQKDGWRGFYFFIAVCTHCSYGESAPEEYPGELLPIELINRWNRRTPPTSGDGLPSIETLSSRQKKDDPTFRAWVETIDDKHWAKYDLSALRIGYELGKCQALLQSAQVGGVVPDAIVVPYGSESGQKDYAYGYEKGCADGHNRCREETLRRLSQPQRE